MSSTSSVSRNRQAWPRWARMLTGAAIALGAAAFLTWICWGWIAYWILGQALDAPVSAGPARDFSMGLPMPPPAAPLVQAAPPPPPKEQPGPAEKHEKFAEPPDTKPPGVRPMQVWLAPANMAGLASGGGGERKPVVVADDDDAGGTGTVRDSAFARDMQTTRIANDKPRLHRFPPRYTIKKGTTFDCTPPMPIDTQMPGPLWCDVDHDVYSMDGTMILIPAHSTANAMIEHGLGLGQDRAVLVFTDILTAGPDFLPIPLGSSPGASDLGQNGVPVDVNEHKWDKIKTALMFAGVEGLTSLGTAALESNRGNTQYNFGSVTGVGQSLAQIAFQHDINIPTTGYRGPGKPIKVYINHYIDLSDFYTVTLRRGR